MTAAHLNGTSLPSIRHRIFVIQLHFNLRQIRNRKQIPQAVVKAEFGLDSAASLPQKHGNSGSVPQY
jgi:hypothetical protein